MGAIKKTELNTMSDSQKEAKIAELEKAILELRGEGRGDKTRPLRKAIAMLRTPRAHKHKAEKAEKK